MLNCSIEIVNEVILAKLRTQLVKHLTYLEALERELHEVFGFAATHESLKTKNDYRPNLINTLTFLASSLPKAHPAIEVVFWNLFRIIECFDEVDQFNFPLVVAALF